MAGDLINDYEIGDTNLDALMTSADAQRIGFHSVSLTEYATTTVPAIAAGSKIEVNGALAVFDTEESIDGSPADGDVYIYLIPEVGTASGATTDISGYLTGSTSITLASAGTGTIIAGDNVTFGSDTVKYKVVTGDSDVSNGGTITIESPGLLSDIPASATAITVYAGAVTAEFTNTAPTWSDAKQGWYGTGGSANYRYLNFIMTKSGSSYSDKRYFLHDPQTQIDEIDLTTGNITTANITNGNITTADITAMITESIASPGYIKIGTLYIQWGSFSGTSNASGEIDVTFPIAFPNNAWSVATGTLYTTTGNLWTVRSLTTTYVRLDTTSGSGFTIAGYYIAIGN